MSATAIVGRLDVARNIEDYLRYKKHSIARVSVSADGKAFRVVHEACGKFLDLSPKPEHKTLLDVVNQFPDSGCPYCLSVQCEINRMWAW